VILARSFIQIPTGQHIARGIPCPIEKENITVHHFKWDQSVFDRSKYMVWLYSMQGEPWFMEPFRFLKYAGPQKKIDLNDPKLEAFWPCLQRNDASEINVINDCYDVANHIPRKNKGIELINEDNKNILVNSNRGKKIQIDQFGANVYQNCSGQKTLKQVIDESLSADVPGGRSITDVERGLQYFLRDLVSAGYLSMVVNDDK
jgi:hypothetical protein